MHQLLGYDMHQLLGYARVSTSDQSPAGQRDALTAAGCERVWTEVASGIQARRPALDELVAVATAGDIVVVTRLDRLGRPLPDLLRLIEDLTAREIGLRSLSEQIDTTSATGRLILPRSATSRTRPSPRATGKPHGLARLRHRGGRSQERG